MPASANGSDVAAAADLSSDASSSKKDGGGSNGRKELVLKSPYGGPPKTYGWPLKKGRGSLRKSEDKEDEAAEIVETIKFICEDHPEIADIVYPSNLISKSNPLAFETMLALCSSYNKAVDKLIASKGLPAIQKRRSRAERPHLKHILQQCYNKSVDDPNELNHYEPFTPEVYGETSFELICQILDKLHPISDDNKFVDLGSGVGQVVLQVAALTNCQISLGIEKAKAPSKFARAMKQNFEYWMDFYGKVYSPFSLIEGDFLDSKYREDILASSIIFVNNFAFGPEVDQRLKDVFADLADGSRIFSSKSFCALNFRITERNLSDIGTIMHVSKMDPLKGSVSWTGKPVSYFLHVIDRAKLERYFQKSAARKEGEEHKRGRRSGRHPNALPNLDESSSGSRDDSRASSIEHDDTTRDSGIRAWNTDSNTRNSDDELTGVATTEPKLRLAAKTNVGRKKGRRFIVKKAAAGRSSSDESTPTQIEISSENQTDSNSSSPPLSETNSNASSSAASRPVRAVVANAAAISVAQQDMNPMVLKNRGRQKKTSSTMLDTSPMSQAPIVPSIMGRKKTARAANPAATSFSSSAALDLLHKATLDSIMTSNQDTTAPAGCVNVRLQIDNPADLNHEELPVSLNTDDQGREIPIELRMFLEKIKKDYLRFIDSMQSNNFRTNVEQDIVTERKRNAELLKREKQLKSQIDNLISDSLSLLKRRLDELGIQAKTPPEFIEKAKMIVCNHHELQRNKSGLEAEIAKLEAAQASMLAKKERELVDLGVRQMGLTHAEAKALARRKIDSAMNNNNNKVEAKNHQILGLSSDVIVTKCSADQLPSSTQIRKRPREAGSKQKDWPEKRHKETASAGVTSSTSSASSSLTASPVKPIDLQVMTSSDKIDEKNPEVLAKKIIEQGRNLERSKALLSPPMSRQPSQSVEVRKIEITTGPPPHHQPTYKTASMHSPHDQLNRYDQPPLPPPPAPRRRPDMVDLPKMEMNMSLVMAGQGSMGEPPLILPPHPASRSASSDLNEELSFASSKMSATPRAEQFEDRLKTIIHSVLTGDGEQDIKPPLSLPMRGGSPASHQPQQQRPMFSPVKKELPSHLPLPPSGVVISPPMTSQYHHRGEMTSPVKRSMAADLSVYPQTSSSRTMNDLIASEIEKSLAGGSNPAASVSPKSFHHDFRGGPFSGLPSNKSMAPGGGSASAAASGMARMSQVIEDSLRGSFERAAGASHRPPAGTKDLEGLACPRTKSPYGGRPGDPGRLGNNGGHDYPVEGLAARFGSQQRAYWQQGSPSGNNGPQDLSAPPSSGYSRVPSYGGHPGYAQVPPGPPPTSSASSSVDPYSRKRSSPQMSPVLPPKKQHLDSAAHDYRGGKEPDVLVQQQQKWQDEISTGFDRLVAYATSIDESRRRSTDDSNSPHHHSANFSSSSSDADVFKSLKQEPFDSRVSALSMKFKGAPSNINFQRTAAGPASYGSSNRAVSSIPNLDVDANADPYAQRHSTNSRSPLPGENLPEHHFKKRYFAETRDFGVGAAPGKAESSYSISPVLPARKRSDDYRSASSPPPRNLSSHSSAASSSHLRDLVDDHRKTNSPSSSSSLLDSTTLP